MKTNMGDCQQQSTNVCVINIHEHFHITKQCMGAVLKSAFSRKIVSDSCFIFLSINFPLSLQMATREFHYTLYNSKRLRALPAHAVVTNQALVYKGAANNVAWVSF